MTENEKLQEAETDLERLIHRAQNVLPTLNRIVEDVSDWRKDIRKELRDHLAKATERAYANQIKRRKEGGSDDKTKQV